MTGSSGADDLPAPSPALLSDEAIEFRLLRVMGRHNAQLAQNFLPCAGISFFGRKEIVSAGFLVVPSR